MALCPALVGPTAVGKTGLVLTLADEYPVEVVSLDSRQIYRGMRIGTAQPSVEERAACPHHLVDFLPPEERYSARLYREAFERVCREVRARGRIPVLVGGTGLYLEVLREGLLPQPADEATTARVRDELEATDIDEIRRRLHDVDPESWERIPPGDAYRSRRALEIHVLTGRTSTEWRRDHAPDPALGLAFPAVVLDREPDELRARIATRTGEMMATGWLDEAETLRRDHPADAPGLATLGYRELLRHLAGEWSLDEARDEIVLRTVQYAKRQRTWFRHHDHEVSGRPDDPAVLDALRRLLDRAASP